MKIELFHSAFEDSPTFIGTFEVPDGEPIEKSLERVYLGTQNLESSWVAKAGRAYPAVIIAVSVQRQGGCRSTSVGDYALANGEKWVCSPVGWTQVSEPQPVVGPCEGGPTP